MNPSLFRSTADELLFTEGFTLRRCWGQEEQGLEPGAPQHGAETPDKDAAQPGSGLGQGQQWHPSGT